MTFLDFGQNLHLSVPSCHIQCACQALAVQELFSLQTVCIKQHYTALHRMCEWERSRHT